MSKRPVFGAFCCAMLLSSSTWAATLEPGKGSLSINQGQGFQPVNGRIDANVGDSVMVGPDGTATVVYDDGCKVNVQPGAVTTIAPLSPCASGSYAQNGPDNGPDWTAIGFAVGVAAAGGVAAYYAVTNNSTTTTGASP
jgi:hypothetical protein